MLGTETNYFTIDRKNGRVYDFGETAGRDEVIAWLKKNLGYKDGSSHRFFHISGTLIEDNPLLQKITL